MRRCAMEAAWRALLAGHRALRPADGPVPARIGAVVIVGASGAGKTTIVDAIRRSSAGRTGRVQVPRRYLTRPRRHNDSVVENTHLPPGEFARRVDARAIAWHWERPLEADRVERYGFPAPVAGGLPVYSGNNALLTHPSSVRPADVLREALIVVVHAPREVRARRLCLRSPDLCRDRPAEIAARLDDDGTAVWPHAHVVVENHGGLEAVAPVETAGFVAALAARWVAPASARS